MDRYDDEPTLADVLSDPVTLAVMRADGVDPDGLTAADQISRSATA
jgi:fumarylacetoacetate (FAA) hydrolase family protein